MYSSIEEEQRLEVIRKCYYPLLELAVEGIPISIEATGLTLEIINRLDKKWIEKLKELIFVGKVEFVGSGYSQIIGPLMPKRLNEINLEVGNIVYREILGIKPKVALVNEMAYSAGLVDLYKNAGYEAISMEWNNQYLFHRDLDKKLRYYPQLAKGLHDKLPIIWADSIAFQKFQRYAQGEITFKEYWEYLNSNNSLKETRYFPIYASDGEIFNFRPGRYDTENKIEFNEWRRIEKLLLCVKKHFEFIFPSQSLEGIQNNLLTLESVNQPIPVKKQQKYNINRWALTGRDDFFINTKLYRIYKNFSEANSSIEDKKEICFLSSSDFRTHITRKRWDDFIVRLKKFEKKLSASASLVKFDIKDDNRNNSFKIKQSKFEFFIETPFLKMAFNKRRGGALKWLIFKEKSDIPVIGTIPHGYYDDITLGADFFSFHAVIERPGKRKLTNLGNGRFHIRKKGNILILKNLQIDGDVEFIRDYIIFSDQSRIGVKTTIKMPRREVAIIHPFNITFLPEAFDKKSLYYSTNNGGDIETFEIGNESVNHAETLSALISAKYGMGFSEGILIIGDKEKSIRIFARKDIGAVIPYLFFKPIDESFFLRVEFSAQEIDDTFRENSAPYTIKTLFWLS